MHISSSNRMVWFKHVYLKRKFNENLNILDVGSYDVNGSYKHIFSENNWKYFGLDIEAGPNVDIIPTDIYKWDNISDEQFDVVVSGQCLEHVEFPWLTMQEISRVLKYGGICFISAPSSATEHRYPVDCYRYFKDGMVALAKYAGLSVLHVSTAGIPKFVTPNDIKFGDWLDNHRDTILIATKKKNPQDISEYEEAINSELQLVELKLISHKMHQAFNENDPIFFITESD